MSTVFSSNFLSGMNTTFCCCEPTAHLQHPGQPAAAAEHPWYARSTGKLATTCAYIVGITVDAGLARVDGSQIFVFSCAWLNWTDQLNHSSAHLMSRSVVIFVTLFYESRVRVRGIPSSNLAMQKAGIGQINQVHWPTKRRTEARPAAQINILPGSGTARCIFELAEWSAAATKKFCWSVFIYGCVIG